MKRHLQRWGGVYAFAGLYLFFWVNYWFTCYAIVLDEASTHRHPFEMRDVWLRWWDGTSENKMSEAWIGVVAALLLETKRARQRFSRAMDEE